VLQETATDFGFKDLGDINLPPRKNSGPYPDGQLFSFNITMMDQEIIILGE
jgi:hypothetical protein